MKTLIIYASYHHNNTEKVALAIANALGADSMKASDARTEDIGRYDTIGIGSGIYGGKFKKELIQFVEQNNWQNKNVFVFSTSGRGSEKYNGKMAALLESKKAKNIGSFCCKGFDTFAILKLFGGISKGHPNEDDIKNAQEFAQRLPAE